MISSKLPEGVTFDENTATVSGIPNKAESFSFKVKAENLLGNVTKSITLTVKDEMPNIPRFFKGRFLSQTKLHILLLCFSEEIHRIQEDEVKT